MNAVLEAMPMSASLRGRLYRHEPMSRHTSWRVGGPAERFYAPADLDDLAAFLAGLDAAEPVLWVGLGSNLLVRDGGLKGTVILTSGLLNVIEPCGEHALRVEAGVACAKVARIAARHGLCGAEFLAGIPGTMGGALAMNAGAFGGETWAIVQAVEVLDHAGARHRRLPGEFDIGYRAARGREDEWFVTAYLQLTPGDGAAAAARIRDLLARRAASQPMGQPSCGSVFRNPPGDHAARLIEASGLKGLTLGGAQISAKHANFIINLGAATAADIEALMARTVATVRHDHGVVLVPEVRVVGTRLPARDAGATGAVHD